jgi:ubiquinone/menaquinone biosynthesis C-methylase UbiE
MQVLYVDNNAGRLSEKVRKEFGQVGNEEKDALLRINLSNAARRHLKEAFDVEWHNCKLLDIGCGQLLRHALIFGTDNKVVGIDIELPFKYPYVFDFLNAIRWCGTKRAVKTAVRQMLGVDRRFRRSLMCHLDVSKLPDIEMYLMDAMQLEFDDNSFDGAYSFSVFQYITDPALAAEQIYRVLKPGGVAYIQLHLYTSMGGSDHPLLRANPEKYPPWGHLRPSTSYYLKHGLDVNCWRLPQYKEMFESIFDEVHYVNHDDEQAQGRQLLTPSIRAELADYSEQELLTSTLTALCRKAK